MDIMKAPEPFIMAAAGAFIILNLTDNDKEEEAAY